MRVRVLYFGVLKELVGTAEEMVALEDGADVAALYDHLRKHSSNDSEVWASLAVAVNREYAGLATKLSDGDEVALLPPVSGGCGERQRKNATVAQVYAAVAAETNQGVFARSRGEA